MKFYKIQLCGINTRELEIREKETHAQDNHVRET